MKTTTGKRIEMLRNHLSLTQQAFANLIGITSTQLSRLENDKNEASKSTLNQILRKIDVNKEWLLEGKGELKAQVIASNNNAIESSIHWKDEAYALIYDQLKKKDEQITQLLAMLGKVNFHKALELTAVPYLLPGKIQGTVSRVHS